MATASRRTKIWVWVIVLALFAGATWVAVSTIRASVQPLGVVADPFPDEDTRPESSEEARGPVNFLVYGTVDATPQTLSIFHLADGRRRIDILNFPQNSSDISDLSDVAGTVQEVETLTAARMEHVMMWDLAFLAELEAGPVSPDELASNPEIYDAETVWTTVLQEALDIRDPGQLNTLASSLTPYVDADAQLNTGRITDLARSIRHVSPDNIGSCTLSESLDVVAQDALQRYFEDGAPRWCAELFD